ncbi:MAG: hypothetical protein NVS3B10_00210 [Polyangiales bacterium]
MAALTKDIKTDQLDTPDVVEPRLLSIPVEANTSIFAGSMVAVNAAGRAVPASAAAGLQIVGLCDRQALNTTAAGFGTAGAINVLVRRGGFYLNAGAGVDAIAQANLLSVCYASDDNTVNLTDAGGTRPPAGVVFDIRSDGKIGVLLGVMGLAPVVAEQALGSIFKARNVVTSIAAYPSVAGVITGNVNGALGAQDGVTNVVGDVVLLQAGIANVAAKDAGAYVVTAVGSGAAKFVLTRVDWAPTGSAIVQGTVVEVGGEGTVFAGSTWKAMCATGLVYDTGAPAFYPRVVKGSQALTAGAATVSNLQIFTAAQASATDTTAAAATKLVLTAGQGTGSIALTGTGTDVLSYAIFNW